MVKNHKEIQRIPSREQVKADIKSIVNFECPEEAIVTLGENRNQLFARIPKIVTECLKLQKGGEIIFKIYPSKEKKPRIEVDSYEG